MRVHLTGIRLLLLRLHFYAGLLVGPFVLVVAATGLMYAAVPPLERAVYGHDLLVEPGPRTVALAEQVAAAQRAARAAFGDDTLLALRPAGRERESTRVVFAPAGHDHHEHTVFVDPHTGEVLGALATDGERLPIQSWVDGLHRGLHLGPAGRVYSELAASWLWVLGVSGSVIWLVRVRRRHRVRRILLPETRGLGRRRLLSWHGAIGLWAVAGVLLLSGTGLAMTRFAGANVTAIHHALHWTEPTVRAGPAPGTPARAGQRHDGRPVDRAADDGPIDRAGTAERVLHGARAAGMRGPVEIQPARRAGEAWVVCQTDRHWPTHLDQAAVDPRTGTVLRRIRFADWPLPVRLARWTADMHAGLLFGALNRALLAVLSLGVICLVVWGYRMWWLRGRHRGGWPRAPGGSIRPTRTAMAAVAVLGVALGLLLPVLGVSLLGMLLLDGVLVASGPTPRPPARDVAAVLSMQEPPPAGDP